MMVKNALVLALGIGVTLAGCATTPTEPGSTAAAPGWDQTNAAPPTSAEATSAADVQATDSQAPDAPPSEATAPPVDPVVEYLDRARAAMETSGGEETARQIYREAIGLFPADKRPWLGLAQSYFELSDYGNTVLAAQEVVLRDPEDETAHGLMAISGLRVATIALGSIRESGDINDTARREAEIMSRNLRVLFGERGNGANGNTTSRAAAAVAREREATPAPRRIAPAPVTRQRPTPAPSAAAPAPAPVRRPAPAPAPAAPSNPFGALR